MLSISKKMFKKMQKTTLILASAASFATASSAQDTRLQVGILECNLGGTVSLIIASEKPIACRFNSTDSGYTEVYYGKMTRIGLDIGVTSGGFLSWLVFAPTNQMTKGALEGDYIGISAEASAGLGLGANVLTGGFDKSFALQPLSVQAQKGVNLAFGIGVMELEAAK